MKIEIIRPTENKVKCCPVCGSTDISNSKNENDYWLDLGKALNVPARLVQELYALWDINEYPNFRQFVRDTIETYT